MKKNPKLPTNLSAEQKQILKKAKATYAFVCDMEIFMSQLHKMLESDQSKKIQELHVRAKDSQAAFGKISRDLGKDLADLGMLPHKPKSAKRAAPTLSK